MTDLAAWLAAQLDADEQTARLAEERRDDHLWVVTGMDTAVGVDYDPAFVLADIAAKRRLIDTAFAIEAKIDGEWGCVHSADQIRQGQCLATPVDEIKTLRLLALPYASRPGYDTAWAPEQPARTAGGAP